MTVWKGLSPVGVKVWPWNPATDTLELGDVVKDTGVEANNGIVMLKKAHFQPVGCTSIDRFSASIVPREQE
jgi:hypothetical protein